MVPIPFGRKKAPELPAKGYEPLELAAKLWHFYCTPQRKGELLSKSFVLAWLAAAFVAFASLPSAADFPVHRPSMIKADRVLIVKGERQLYLLRKGMIYRTYPIDLGRDPDGPKIMEGDGRTPEGEYVLDWRNPTSRFTDRFTFPIPTGEMPHEPGNSASAPAA